MDLQTCLADFWRSNPKTAADLLQISSEKLQDYIKNGVNKNVMLMFHLATILEIKGYTVDGFSNLPQVNRQTIVILLTKGATVDDYLQETSWQRDTFIRYLKNNRELSSRAIALLTAANDKFLATPCEEREQVVPTPKPVDQITSREAKVAVTETDLLSEKSPTNQIDNQLIFNLILGAAANAKVLEGLLENFIKSSSKEDRIYLRDNLSLAGFSLFSISTLSHHLTNKLGALCSEKALENYVTKK